MRARAGAREAGPRGRLTERDLEVLGDVVRFSAVTVAQIQRRHFTGRTAAYLRLQRIAEHGLLRHVRLLAGEAGVYVATGPGAELADVDLPAARFKPHQLVHTLAVGDLADHLRAAYPGSVWTTERELRRDILRTRRESDGRLGRSRMSRTPDGLLTLADGTTVAVELELTIKSQDRYKEILNATAAHRPAKKVWWFVKSAAARERIAKLARPYRLPEGFLELRPWPPAAPTTESSKQ